VALIQAESPTLEVRPLSWIDIAILVAIIWFTFAAFHAGMIREVITLFGAGIAVALAGQFYEELAGELNVLDDEETAEVAAFALIFGAVILASQVVAMFLKQAASLMMLGLFDSVGGAFVGFAKGLVLVEMGLIFAITFTSLGLEKAVEDSALAPVFLEVAPFLKAFLPAEFKDAIDAF
jgi:membrane protein required for colicin V production